ncbi:AAA family ATPase [Streptomyces sp. NPDC002659]|uniref:AAA family ATPase n=1 Tax=Streptomyces sp. NPDC002659 TaxID=3364656 RepID=UPI0036C22119
MTTAPTSQNPPDRSTNYHYLGLAGAHTILTNASQETYANLVTTLKANGGNGAMMCVHGGVGLGKTFAVNLHLDELAPHTTLRVKLSSAKLQALREALYKKLDLPGEPPDRITRCENMIRAALSEGPRVLVVDEAQWLDTRAFEFIRELWDDENTRFAVVLVGAENCYQKIKKRPALESRILLWQRYTPLTPTEVLTTIPQYHPIWTGRSADDLLWIDDLACHGNFRQWARVTYLLQEAMDTPPYPAYSRDLVRAVFSRLDPTSRHAT